MDTLWLKGSDGRSRFFPDRNNEYFDFTSDVGLFVTTLIVEGTAFSTRSSAGVSQPAIASRVQSISVQPLFSRRPSNTTGFVTVKILYSMMKKSATGNKLEFKKLHQMFVKVTESTANVHYITHMVRDKWSNHNLVLVSANGLLIEDCTGTQGKVLTCSILNQQRIMMANTFYMPIPLLNLGGRAPDYGDSGGVTLCCLGVASSVPTMHV